MPRSTAGQARRKSSRVGHSRVIFCDQIERLSSPAREVGDDLADAEHADRERRDSRCRPRARVMPKVKRVPPVLPSVPTRPTSRPSMIMATALSTEPCASTTAAIRPSTISEKYSGAPNDWPTLASGGAKVAISAVETHAGEERAERRDRERGAGARPARAIWWPSMQVTTDEVSPGRLTRIAVVEPPYCAP